MAEVWWVCVWVRVVVTGLVVVLGEVIGVWVPSSVLCLVLLWVPCNSCVVKCWCVCLGLVLSVVRCLIVIGVRRT